MIRQPTIVLAAALAALIISGILVVISLHERRSTLDRTDHSVCVAIQNINRIVTMQLQRSKANLPKLAYFQAHPDELRDQLRGIDRQLEAFKPRRCT